LIKKSLHDLHIISWCEAEARRQWIRVVDTFTAKAKEVDRFTQCSLFNQNKILAWKF